MDLYRMLRDIQDSGGTIEATMPSWFSQQAWRGLLTRLDNIRDCCRELHGLIPSMREALEHFISEQFITAIQVITDGVVMAIDAGFGDQILAFLDKLQDVDNYIKMDVMNQLSYIIDQLKKVKVDETLFAGIERKLTTLRKTVIDYGKKITAIKNFLDKAKLDEMIGTNKELLEQIIENKERFEPEIKDILDSIEEKIKEPANINIDELKDFISSQTRQLLQNIPLDLQDYFYRVIKQIEDSEKNIEDILKEERERVPTIITQPSYDIINPQLSDDDFDMFTSIVENKIQDEMEELDNRLREIENAAHQAVTFSVWDEFRKEVRESFKSVEVTDLRLWSMEDTLNTFTREFNEFNKEKRWQKVVKDMLDRHFPNMEDNIAQQLKREINAYFDQEFTELYRVLNTLNNPEAMEELEQEITEKELERDLSTDLYNAMEKYEKEERARMLRGEGTTISPNLIFKGTDAERQLQSIDDKLDEALDSLDDINPRGDEAQRTLDDDREKQKKRREEPL